VKKRISILMRGYDAKGHDFRDYICPDFIEKHSDYLMVLGGKFCRVPFLKDYANYIKDSALCRS
jgi:hypothetical protein